MLVEAQVGLDVARIERDLASDEVYHILARRVARALERTTGWAHIPSYDRGLSVGWRRGKTFGFQSVSAGADYRYYGGFYDEQLYANTAANGPTTRTTSGAGPYTHDYAPDTGALPTVRAATWEFVVESRKSTCWQPLAYASFCATRDAA